MKNIATKELNYVKDFLSWELLSAKKCYQYAQQETNPQRKQLFMDTVNVHQQNYMSLLNYINQLNNEKNNTNTMNMNQGGQVH
ncbi:hypothetical protein [Geosporobacter ferrireducens]|uniref:Spore coat protein n=1 Tax=Geosporobacter ferrireducens TaxID=1424294 RepID=A0A1D8GDR3_9FIRM|nr:hypothetical protein [Geosporobacter ferrireducens]AOT69034.1 hypothetical protein Gferi_05350 [Geosporobacter ferrireducens]